MYSKYSLLVCFTFDAGHLLATGPTVQVDLTGDQLLHLDKVGQEQDDLHFVVGQVSSTADALSSLNMGPTQKDHSGPLMVIFWGESVVIQKMTKEDITPQKPQTTTYKIPV